MTTYKITIKDNSIPEYMKQPNYIDIFTTNIEYEQMEDIEHYKVFFNKIRCYISEMATELDTDPESLEILSIIKQ